MDVTQQQGNLFSGRVYGIQKDMKREITQHKNIDIVCLVTSDKDYIDTIRELRSCGKRIVVIGEEQATDKLRNACSKFIEI